ncbi:hypothetical protein [Luteolibacter marinus]|uniref:hypothetical protein n=1 Tax=Luteolibacter marinus TaxID=2776705 RepID=UPI0018670D5D|nr:hypothetical protein [Luteolibacter marinus]
MKHLALFLSLTLPATLDAEDIKIEAVVLEIPNQHADALVKEGRSGATEPWKKVLSPEGQPLKGTTAKLVSRLEAKDFNDGNANERVAVDEGNGIQRTYYYRVDVKDATDSRRTIGVTLHRKGSKSLALEDWSIDLAAPLTAEWSFSARHRSSEVSRIVLEKSAVLSTLDGGSSKWTAMRMLERKRAVGKRVTEIDSTSFQEDPDETYRVEWRHRDGDVGLFHRNSRNLDQGGSAIDLGGDNSRSYPIGESSHFNRGPKGLTWSIRSGSEGKSSGSKIRILNTAYMCSISEADTTPLGVQRPATQSITTWKGSVGDGKEQSSRVHVQIIAE